MVMLDLGFLRDNLPLVEQKLRDRGILPDSLLGEFKMLDENRRGLIQKIETYRAEANLLSQEIGKSQQQLKKMSDGAEKDKLQKWVVGETGRLRGQKYQ